MNEQIELWAIDKVLPYDRNAKKHAAEKIDQIAGWIKRSGWTQPIVVQKSTGLIIAGHGRRLAAIKLGLTAVPVIVKDVDEATAKAMRLADNQAVSTDYDTTLLQSEIIELKDLGFQDIDSLGFNEKELGFLNESVVVFNDEAFITDITAAVDEQREENHKEQEETDVRDAPLSKAFGFKRLTIAQGRKIRNFMNYVEVETGKTGAPALLTYIDDLKLANI